MAAKAKKAFSGLVTSLLATERWTLSQYRSQLTESMAGEMWKLRVPGFRSSAQAVEYKSMMKVLEALTDEELEDKSLLRGLRLMRVARQSEQPVRFVNQVLSRFDQTAMLHMWLHRQHDEGRALPTTMEEAHERMAADPAVRRYSAGMASSKVIQRRINRRGSL